MPKEVEKAAMIIRAHGHVSIESGHTGDEDGESEICFLHFYTSCAL